jgi:hypothetical protein
MTAHTDNPYAHWDTDLLIKEVRAIAAERMKPYDADRLNAAADRLEALYHSTASAALPSGTVSEREAVLRERRAFLRSREFPECHNIQKHGECEMCAAQARYLYPNVYAGSVPGAVSEGNDHD